MTEIIYKTFLKNSKCLKYKITDKYQKLYFLITFLHTF